MLCAPNTMCSAFTVERTTENTKADERHGKQDDEGLQVASKLNRQDGVDHADGESHGVGQLTKRLLRIGKLTAVEQLELLIGIGHLSKGCLQRLLFVRSAGRERVDLRTHTHGTLPIHALNPLESGHTLHLGHLSESYRGSISQHDRCVREGRSVLFFRPADPYLGCTLTKGQLDGELSVERRTGSHCDLCFA